MKHLTVLLFLANLVVPAAQPVEPRASAELAGRTAFLGDAVALTLQLTYHRDQILEPMELPEELGKATVLTQVWSEPQIVAETDLVRRELNATLAWYQLGEQKLPPIEIRWEGPDGSFQEVTTPELTIEILAMLSEEDSDLAPGKGQVDMQVMPLWPWIAGAVILLAGVLAAVLWWLSRRTQKETQEYVEPVLPPYDEAMQSLETLTHGSLLKEGKYKEFHVEINQIIRHYYARLFPIHAEEMTSMEVEDWISAHDFLPEGLYHLNREFQVLCDRVKFAKHDPLESENKESVNRAYQIVALLKPEPVEEVADVATG